MKYLKLYILNFLIFFTITNSTLARFELMVLNFSTTDLIYIQVYPVGAIFNGNRMYTLQCKYPTQFYTKIFGGDTILPNYTDTIIAFEINHDVDALTAGTRAAIGFGKYRVDFYEVMIQGDDTIINSTPFDHCDVDFSDSDYPNYGFIPGGPNFDRDILFPTITKTV